MAERSLENSLPAGIGRITESILEEARQTAEEMEKLAEKILPSLFEVEKYFKGKKI